MNFAAVTTMSQRSSFVGTIRKRSGKWQAQIRRKGFTSHSKTFTKKTDAQEWVRKREAQLDRHELEPDRKVLDTTRLRDIIVRYRDEVVPRKRGAFVETVVLNAFLRHWISSRTLSSLSAKDFAEYRDERLAKVSTATVKRQLTPIRTALNVARREWGYPLRYNPAAELSLSYVDNRRQRRLREGELDLLIKGTERTRNPILRQIILLALETGMRRGEILSIRWEHLDLQNRFLVIPEAKNGHSRVIPLTPLAQKILGQLANHTECVFPITGNALRLAWERLTKRVGIKDLHFHDLRHEAISRFFDIGLTVPEVASISGHRDTRMLMRYAHPDTVRLSEKLASGSCPSE